ncbi:SpaA isopeptide-forming pilin-related protein [Lacticaseibacillus salsurivasis]|uniref:SpaA isopeptide-forming pilin-related protein n=1 Tax=Lacticaseibacillus salsurivasis TaxID=3081441 RepID=UPI0030C70943
MASWNSNIRHLAHTKHFARIAAGLLVFLTALQLVPTRPSPAKADSVSTETYATDPINAGTEQDVLFEAGRFALFGDTVNLGHVTLEGNFAANTLSGSTSVGTRINPLYPHDAQNNAIDLFYINHFADKNDPPNFNGGSLPKTKIVVGADNTVSGQLLNDRSYDAKTTLSQNPDYIDIDGTLSKLRSLSKQYAQRGYQFNQLTGSQLTNLGISPPASAGMTLYDMNNMNASDTSQTYEDTYAMKIQKTDSEGKPLAGAIFELQYPTFPEDEADVRYDRKGFAIPTGWASVWDLIQKGGRLPQLYGWNETTSKDDVNQLDDDDSDPTNQRTASQVSIAEKEKTGNPQYQNGKLVLNDKVLNLFDRNHNLITDQAAYIVAMTTLAGSVGGDADINGGSINVSLNIPGRYRFYELQAPNGYRRDSSTTTQVDTLTTAVSPEAKVLTIPWTAMYTQPTSDSNKSISALYLLNVSFAKNSVPIIINVDFTGAPDDIKANAPNVHMIAPENSGGNGKAVALDKTINFVDNEFMNKNTNKILWNFINTGNRTINVANDNLPGTILAPSASISADGGHVFGSIIAKTITVGSGTIHRWDFDYQIWSKNNNKTLPNKPAATTNVTVKKQWQDLEATETARPTTVKMQLYRRTINPSNGATNFEPIEDPVTLSAQNDWQHQFSGLPTNDANGDNQAYLVKEVDEPADYTPIYDISYAANGDMTTTVTNVQDGFTITKLAQGTTHQLAGAEYKVWSLPAGISQWTETTTTTTADNLNPLVGMHQGIYLIQETKAPAGYLRDPTIYGLKLSMTNHETIATSWQTPTADGTPHFAWQTQTFSKVDLTQAQAAAAADSGWYDLAAANSDGANPVGFSKPAGTTNQVYFTQEDVLKPLRVIKVDADDDNKTLSGATFLMGLLNASKTYTTDADGLLPELGMKPDNVYQVRETAAPVGYKQNGTQICLTNGRMTDDNGQPLNNTDLEALPVVLTEKEDALELRFKDESAAKPWQIAVQKLDSDTDKPLAGAVFTLTTSSGSTVLKPDQMATSSVGFKPGTRLTVNETSAPSGYACLTGNAVIDISKSDKEPTVTLNGDFNTYVTVSYYPSEKAGTVLLKIRDPKKGILPRTGGTGPLKPFLLSALLAAVAMMLLGIAWLQHKREGEDR